MLRRIVPLAPYAILVVFAYMKFGHTLDDPFITFRFARNLGEGHGAVFNAGERVEGYTSPLHMAACAALLYILPGIGILFKAKLLGILFAALTVWQTARLTYKVGFNEGGRLLAQVLLAGNFCFVFASINGLETTMFCFVVTACICRYIEEDKSCKPPVSAILAFIAVLVRPEGMLFGVCLATVGFAPAIRKLRGGQDGFRWLALFLALTAGFLVLRYSYYGDLMPNTFYAKRALLLSAASNGLQYVLSGAFGTSYPIDSSPMLVKQAWILLYLGLAVTGFISARKVAAAQVIGAIVLSNLVFVLVAGGDWMPAWRFMVATVPMMAILQVYGIQALHRGLDTDAHWGRTAGVVAAVLAFPLFTSARCTWQTVHFATDDRTLLRDGSAAGPLWAGNAEYIHASMPAHSTVAYTEMGYAGYTNMQINFLDLRGLCSRDIARSTGVPHETTGVEARGQWFLQDGEIYRHIIHDPPFVLIVQYIPPTEYWSNDLLFGIYKTAGQIPGIGSPNNVYVRAESVR